MPTRSLFARTLTVAVALSIAACSETTPTPNSPGAKAGQSFEREREVASPGSCLGKQRLFEALGVKDNEPAPARTREKYRTDPLAGSLSPSEAYRIAAPSTVIIRTRDGLGSGVVIDASGLVLTNHHVVDDFLQPDLTMNVSLELPEVEPTGRVKRSGHVYQGVVLKADAVKDLALVRMKDPPKNLVPIKLSKTDPQVGENVVSVGNAGIGLLWAAKVCNVSGVGDQTHDTSMLEVGDCKLQDLSDSDAETKRREEQCEARKRQIREEIASATQGLAVQTSCNITHGDSGGPLVNAYGELVGLNESIRFDAATVAFHVHVAEVRAFLREIPTTPNQIVPDPWCEGGAEASFEDVDGDGKKDTLKLVGNSIGHRFGVDSAEATFIDLDQDDDAAKRTKDRPFDADMVVLRKHEDTFAFYDTDDDGRFDLVLRDKEGEGDVDLAWRWKNGKYESDASLKGRKIVDVAFVTDPKRKQRLGLVAQGLGWTKMSSEETLAVAESITVPDIFAGTVQMANAMAEGPNDKPIGVQAIGPSGDRMFIDTKSPALQALKNGDDARKLLEAKALTPDMAMVGRPNGRWVLYDTDSDGKLDLALFAKNPSDKESFMGRSGQFVTDAFDIKGEQKKAPQYVGRSIMRPKLLSNEKARKAATTFAWGSSGDDGRSTFPKVYQVMTRSPWKFGELDKVQRRTMERMDADTAVALIDLDGDTKEIATKGTDDIVRQQSYDWEVAFYRTGRLVWAFYDTDGDGAYDLVLFTKDVKKPKIDAAFTVDRSGDKVTFLEKGGDTIIQPERASKNAKTQSAIREVWQRVVDSVDEGKDDKKKKPSTPAVTPKK